MNPETVEEIHHLYNFLAYWANNVIFVLSGEYIGKLLTDPKTLAHPLTLAMGFIAYILSLVSRGSVFFLIGAVKYYIHKRRGTLLERNYWKTQFFTVWAGLRGAVALMLAIELYLSVQDSSLKKEGQHVMLYADMTVLFSIVVQGIRSSGYYQQYINKSLTQYKSENFKPP